MAGAAAKPKGGQWVYTKEIADLICLRMENGETLRQVCRDDDMPSAPTVCRWVINDHDGFAERYARAREALLEHWAEEVVSISDSDAGDTFVDDRGKTRVDYENIHRSRLRVDTRKWLLSKLKPEKYGERVTVKNEGDGDVGAEPEGVAQEKRETWQHKHGNGKVPETLQ